MRYPFRGAKQIVCEYCGIFLEVHQRHAFLTGDENLKKEEREALRIEIGRNLFQHPAIT